MIRLHVELAQPKVTERDVAREVEQNILRFEVTVDNVELMQMLEREEELRAIKARALLVEPLITLQMVEELSSIDESVCMRSASPRSRVIEHVRTERGDTASAPTGS